MSSPVFFRDQYVWCNNRHFSNLLDFAIETGQLIDLSTFEKEELMRVKKMRDNDEFWPGRGFVIEEDFPAVHQCKLWARIYYDLAQAIFERELGNHENSAWQTQAISFAMQIAGLFLQAVREHERGWYPDTRASRSFKLISRRNDT